MRRGWITAWAIAAAAGLCWGCGGGGEAASDGGAGIDTGTGTGDDWESPYDGSVWGTDPGDGPDTESACDCDDPACGLEYGCVPDVEECECGTTCADAYYASIGWGSYFQGYLCYAPCGDGVACEREGDVCTELSDGESLCLPRMEATSDGFDVKVVPAAEAYSIADAAQVDVALAVRGETRHLIMAFGAADAGYVELLAMESGIGDFYELQIDILESAWAPGTVLLSDGTEADGGAGTPVADFSAMLYRGTEAGDMWVAGQAVSGSLELVETPEIALCEGPGCPKAVIGQIQIEIAGLGAEF